ncbi:DASS family sodium-coupled anion symporter [Novosphingobium sp. TH158]|uniref:SLC13 family permease n=1 Tax=Novosphingobium sp. TH158 TaxID=2067455 RepID=UPI000C7CFE8E|nr:DASS family sodium-coupled anion symporter [Novosphingobium sp. TH158]PLK27458.1 C4-dicarboxylate ABC transporter [Novosphingobium sp. TH158]
MTTRRIGFWLGLAGFILTLLVPPPGSMPDAAWPAAGLVWWMAVWWMTEALPLYATAILPFIVLPLVGVADANKTASAYYSPIMFLFIAGAFLALAIERTGLHRRLALFIMGLAGAKPWQLLLGVMMATALLSSVISNTSTALIMMPMALAMLAAGGVKEGETEGIAGALPMGIAFAASIGGLGTLIGTPTNAIAVGLIDKALGVKITFLEWSIYGMPIVLIAVPLAAFIIARVQNLRHDTFDPAAARAAIAQATIWSTPERRLLPVFVLAMGAWIAQPWLEGLFPKGGLTDGTIAAIAGLVLFVLPDGTGRPMLLWREANRAPWDVVLMFGGGLALAMGMTESGLAAWMGEMLLPLKSVPLPVVALALVAFVILITEFASNIATASGIMPVVAALVVALGGDPILLALPAAIASTWGFMLPAGTGPNAIAWGTGHVALGRVVKAGLALDLAGVFLIVGVVWMVHAVV